MVTTYSRHVFGPIAASILALAATLQAQYDPKAAEPIPRLGGTLILGGGGSLPEETHEHFVRMAGGDSATIVILAAKKVAPSIRDRFAESTKVVTVLWRKESVGDQVDQLEAAKGVWIVGDDPVRFAMVYRGSPVEAALQSVIARGGVIGANGAITRAFTRIMIAGGDRQAQGLDLVPGAVIDDDFSRAGRKERILAIIKARPAIVGLGIEMDTVMVLHRRFIDVLGKGSVHGCIAASKKRPLRIDRMNRRESPASQRLARRPPRGGRRGRRPRRLGDLIALSRSAQARVAPRFPAWSPEPPDVKKGSLIIIGGGGLPQGLMEKFIELAGGPDAPLLYVPCDERDEISRVPRTLARWRRLGAKNVDWIHTKDRSRANSDKELLDKIRKARGVFFGGGRQWNLVDSYQNTTAHKLMHDVLARGGVIAGSSAGASIQGSYMVRGNSVGNLDAMAEGYETGLGFLTGVGIDQHFSQRRRLPDMTGLVDTYPELLGIGLDEASSIIVRGTVAEAYSRTGRNVHIYDRTKPVVKGQPDYLLLAHGQRYDLKARQRLDSVKQVKQAKPKAAKQK